MKDISEKFLEEKFSNFLRERSWFKVSNQVGLSRKRIDVVAKSEILNQTWAFEIKVKDWKTALRQANLNVIACNSSFVAIWHKYKAAPIRNRKTFEENGIGLVVIGENYELSWVIPPQDENRYNIQAYERVSYSV